MAIVIDVAAEFTGQKAFNQASKATDSLTKSVKHLGKSLGIAFGIHEVVAFGKASVKAFTENEKAFAILGNTLKNLGQGSALNGITAYIDKLTLATGVAKSDLIPAYQGLFVATGSVTKAQDALNLALDVAAGTGKDLNTVQVALSKAYLGNYTSLTRLGAGLSKALIKTGDMVKITDQLKTTFGGSAAVAADTYAGKLARIGVAAEEARITIGKGLVDAFVSLSKDTTVATLSDDMQSFALYTADAIRGVGLLVAAIMKIPGIGVLKNVLGFAIKTSPLGMLADLGAQSRRKATAAASKNPIQSGSYLAAAATQAKVAKQTLAVNTASLKLAKAKATFDLQNIEIAAALKGKISEEDRIRLLLMQAIQDENISNIDKYTKMLADAQAKTAALQAQLDALKATQVPNPFASWTLTPLQDQLTWLDSYLKAFVGNMASAFNTLNAQQQALLGGYVPFVGAATPQPTSVTGQFGNNPDSVYSQKTAQPSTTTVQVTVQGTVVAEQDLAQTIVDVINNAATQGVGFINGQPARAVAI